MKKTLIVALLATFSFGVANAGDGKCKLTHNKATKAAAKGVTHGYYMGTHNKITKLLRINDGNVKYNHHSDDKNM